MDNSEAEVTGSHPTGLIIETNSECGSQTSMDSYQTKKRKMAMKDKDEEIETMEDDPCGICLAEEATYRGKMNCCDHYFCFVCIFEWSKVENRCPSCRQRFTTIFKMGSNSSKSWMFRVPVRDQVHVPTDEDIGAQDSYADVYCTLCSCGDDENLLLLCDLCDSAAHTFCVGLGRTVPTGEWYCRECESSYNVNSDTDEDEDEEYVPEFHNKCTSSSNRSMAQASSTAETVATINIEAVLPSSSMSKYASNTPSRRRTRKKVIHRQVPRLSNVARALRNPSLESITVAQVTRPTSRIHSRGARTLSDQRFLQDRIQAMRENWKSLQQGELQFSSTIRIVDGTNTGTQAGYKNCINEKRQRIDSQTDVDQAWLLMERAKSLGAKNLGFDDHQEVTRSHKAEKSHLLSSSRIDKQLLQFSSRNLSVSNRIVDRANTVTQSAYKNCLNKNKQRVDSQSDIDRAWTLMECAKSSKDLGSDDRQGVPRSQKADKSHPRSLSLVAKQLLEARPPTSSRPVERAAVDSRVGRTSIGQQSSPVLKNRISSVGLTLQRSSSLIAKQLLEARPPTSSRPVERAAVDSRVGRTSVGQQSSPVLKNRIYSVGLTLQPSSGCSATSSKMHTFQTGDCEKTKGNNHAQTIAIHKEENAERLSINLSGRSNKAEASAKELISSLVKTHLMPIYKMKRLGSFYFKEIARMSTHTILAACGLEHSERMVQHFQKISCCHSDKQRSSPSLMRMCCNECFDLFVKDVVDSIAQKQSSS